MLSMSRNYWTNSPWPVHKEYVKVQSAKNNPIHSGSEASLLSLQKHFATKKGRIDVQVPVALRLQENPSHFSSFVFVF